ncbi:EscU/YscU/HrcU family type III secretion system export apparatus switch protein [uncultured Cohaesibacter sp.]|uniref:EscU/YscU/HrcU family type III secretion system export apparatus switch protein n=1 Tax=uncultured Cohaesibacter sp. TaxID=1002546 RepID=UPI002AA66430|nr:EscU/YscU/HrcU family type III secretion system export apparatus switch protein [uncultured Cohaesibacter sp.]
MTKKPKTPEDGDFEAGQEGSSSKLAVALHYDEGVDEAPRVTAKGRGKTADRIIELAKEHGVIVEGNPALTQALADVELNEVIPENLYAAVAVVINFVMQEAEKKQKGPLYRPPATENHLQK